MQFEINFNLPEAEFRKHIENFISNARKTESVLPLPCHIGDYGIEIAALVLSQVNCTACDARCCRMPIIAEFGIPFLDTEYRVLEERVGAEKLAKIAVKSIGNNKYMPTPCPFLRKNMCSIYDIRPIVCVNYPLDQFGEDNLGEKMVGLDPVCPEARRITKHVYLTFWKLLNKMQEASSQIQELKNGAQQEEILRSSKRTEA